MVRIKRESLAVMVDRGRFEKTTVGGSKGRNLDSVDFVGLL